MKKDRELGYKVHQHLINQGIETPMFQPVEDDAKDIIEQNFQKIMLALGLDLSDDSLESTPRRVAKMYVDEIFYGLSYENFPKATTVENKMQYDEMIVVDQINVQSNCEHHFVVIDGAAKVAYVPNQKVLGLSKINRIVEFFSKRPQIQERLTEQIYHALCFILETENVAVQINATHYCVKSRGIQDVNSYTTTAKIGGIFKTDQSARAEFLAYKR